jgi:hypothetical protein
MKNYILPFCIAGNLLFNPLLAPASIVSAQESRTKSFLEEISNECRENIYFENKGYRVVESSSKFSITPAPEDEFTSKAVIFAYLMKKSLDEVVEPVGKLNREIKKLKEELVDESYSFYTGTGIQIFDDNDLVELANMPTPYEDRLLKNALQNFDVLVGDATQKKIDWKQTMYNYLDFSSVSGDLTRESLERRIEQKETLKDINDKRMATLSYSIQNSMEQIAGEYADYYIVNKADISSSEMQELVAKVVSGNAMNYVGFVDPRFSIAMRALSSVMLFDKLLDQNGTNFSEFSYEDAKKLYFSPQIHKEVISELYAYAKIFEGVRKSEFKYEVPAFNRNTRMLDAPRTCNFKELFLDENLELLLEVKKKKVSSKEEAAKLIEELNNKKGYWNRIDGDAYNVIKEFAFTKELNGILPYSFVLEGRGWLEEQWKSQHNYSYGWWFRFLNNFYEEEYMNIEIQPLIDGKNKIKRSYFFLSQDKLDALIGSYYNRLNSNSSIQEPPRPVIERH